MSIKVFEQLAVRVPKELADTVRALVVRRTTEEPFRRYSLGDALRELLARGLESVAAETEKD